MFICQKTGRQSQPGEASRKLVTKTRKREYFKQDPKTGEQVKAGEGWEIVEELTVCQEVYDAATKTV
jgi:hypothetical protein